ncbi:MAG: hypothetical protein ACRD82_23930 [Blastocatellia bacterium]
MKSLFVGIKNVILWSYERGTWQYDALCLLIIGTVFLVPSRYFGDRDREAIKTVKANESRISASEPGETVHEVTVTDLQIFLKKLNKPELILNSPQEALTLYLSDKLKHDVSVSKFEPFINPQTRINGYRVWTK